MIHSQRIIIVNKQMKGIDLYSQQSKYLVTRKMFPCLNSPTQVKSLVKTNWVKADVAVLLLLNYFYFLPHFTEIVTCECELLSFEHCQKKRLLILTGIKVKGIFLSLPPCMGALPTCATKCYNMSATAGQ